ncbi:minor capsid protein [Salinicoccus roseus]|uniref:minor capsid protein n=1 Tax=Salinicoccus roseus TaxID=45670 RepID=UPI0023014CC3|nr:minor capsid protein [Salinicoccus roseus]
MTKNSEALSYWEQREADNLKREQMLDDEVIKQLQGIIESTMDDIEAEIDRFIRNYAAKEGISQEKARRKINRVDIAKYKDQVDRYSRMGRLNEVAEDKLRLYNVTMRVNREYLLKAQLNAHLVAMTSAAAVLLEEHLTSSFMRELERQAAILGEMVQVTDDMLRAIVGASFYSATWSTRIWKDQDELRKQLNKVIRNSLIRGQHPYKAIKEVRERMDVSTYSIKRLLITEVARVQTEAQRLSYLKHGGEEAEYRYLAKMDNRTTKTCRKLHRSTFKVKDMMPGVNAPPMHPFCRSATYLMTPENWRDEFFRERAGRYDL